MILRMKYVYGVNTLILYILNKFNKYAIMYMII